MRGLNYMSASDKKKQRIEASRDALTQRERRQQADAKAAKRRKKAYVAVGVVCGVAAAALLIWNSAFWEKSATAATVDGVQYKSADLQYYYSLARQSFASMYSQYGMSPPFDASDQNSDGSIWFDESQNMTYADYFRQSALDQLKRTAVICKAAQQAGYTLSDLGQKTLNEELRQIDRLAAQNGLTRSALTSSSYGTGVTEKVYLRNRTNDLLASEYASFYQDGLSYDEAALTQYYEEHKDELDRFTYRSFPIDGTPAPATDAEGNSVEATDAEKEQAMQAAKARADAAVKEIETASDAQQAFLKAAADYVDEDDKDTYSDPDASLQERVQGSILPSVDSLAASWVMDSGRKAGDVTVLEKSSGYQVVLFLKRERVDDPTVDVRHILIRAETADADNPDTPDVDESKTPTQEALDAAKAKAQNILDEWKTGEATQESFAALAEEYSEDGRSSGGNLAAPGGEYTYVSQGQMVQPFNDWIFDPARQSGETGLVQTDFGWHIIYFVGPQGPAWQGEALTALRNAGQSDWINSLLEAATAQAENGMKFVGGRNTAQPSPSESPAESAAPEDSAEPQASESPAS